MREFKFRAWIKPSDDDPEGSMFSQESKSDFAMVSNGDGFGVVVDMEEWAKDDSFVIMQYTGRKDSRGIEIYEGDILKAHGIVAWNDVELMWSRIDLNWNDKREWSNLESLTSPLEVIGNIHQNPELLID